MGWEVVKRGSVVVALRAELAVIEGDQQRASRLMGDPPELERKGKWR